MLPVMIVAGAILKGSSAHRPLLLIELLSGSFPPSYQMLLPWTEKSKTTGGIVRRNILCFFVRTMITLPFLLTHVVLLLLLAGLCHEENPIL